VSGALDRFRDRSEAEFAGYTAALDYLHHKDPVAAARSVGPSRTGCGPSSSYAPATFSIAHIRRAVPGVSDNTIRIALGQLKDAGLIANDGTGRGATWRRL
jgi:hypothetical protein